MILNVKNYQNIVARFVKKNADKMDDVIDVFKLSKRDAPFAQTMLVALDKCDIEKRAETQNFIQFLKGFLNSSDDFYLAISGESKILGGAKITSSGWSSYSTKVYLLGKNEKAKNCLKYAACQDKSLYAQNCADEVIKLKKAIGSTEIIQGGSNNEVGNLLDILDIPFEHRVISQSIYSL